MQWTAENYDRLFTEANFRPLAVNILQLKVMSGVSLQQLAAVRLVESAFANVFDMAGKLFALIYAAKTDRILMDRIIKLLATFLNQANPRILAEAYRRLEEIAERLYETAWFHVRRTGFQRVVPVQHTLGSDQSAMAFVYPFDPAGRVMVRVPGLMQTYDMTQIILHELMHLSTNMPDYLYLRMFGHNLPDAMQHNDWFGALMFRDQGASHALNRSPQARNVGDLDRLEPIDNFDRVIAQARVLRHFMLLAQAIFSNPDSMVVFVKYLLDNIPMVRFGPGDTAWRVVREPPVRSPRSAPPFSSTGQTKKQEDLMTQRLKDDILASFLTQALATSPKFYLSDEQVDEMNIMTRFLNGTLGTN